MANETRGSALLYTEVHDAFFALQNATSKTDRMKARTRCVEQLVQLSEALLDENECEKAMKYADLALSVSGCAHANAASVADRADAAVLTQSGHCSLSCDAPDADANVDANISAENVQRITTPDEFAWYAKNDSPCIIHKLAERWPAMQRWDVQSLVHRFGHRYVPLELEHASRSQWHEKTMQLKEFAENFLCTANPYLASKTSADGRGCTDATSDANSASCWYAYMAQHPLLRHLPSLVDDIQIPTDFIGEVAIQESHAWAGMKGTRTRLHNDQGVDNLLCVVKGVKRVELYPPSQAPLLYVKGNISAVDVDHPDYDTFPEFRNASGCTALLRAGDALYIPAYWYHYVMNESQYSVAVSLWF